ncbi:IS110 family transposase [Streptomyces adustus]|uniref:IS110 family transposase n=1 Tax=Streptomyces adustus TaxID=1609272 RepID=A0A5N8V4V1_9ACTN|nr:IS110 family transposase [Streptomyces adustus]MPY30193.1 IS110 family transposase [Streptomyces adustus]
MTHRDAAPHGDLPATEEVLLGVDTHKDTHVAAVVTVLGTVLDSRSFPATADGYRQLLSWARSFGVMRRAGVECTGSYGAALTRYLQAEDVSVTEVNQPDKQARRRHGKSDSVDAHAAAHAVLSGRATATAKAGHGSVEMLRLFKLAKASAIKSRTQAINQLKAVLVATDPALRENLSGLSIARLVRACTQLDAGTISTASDAARHTLRLLARRVQNLSEEINDLTTRMKHAVQSTAPTLLDQHGVGPDIAACLLVAAGDNPERLHSEAAFAALAGVSPVEASSGKTQRRRLNRGGDRQANAALHFIVLSRLRWDHRTQDYMQRRLAQGKTRREVIRCLMGLSGSWERLRSVAVSR